MTFHDYLHLLEWLYKTTFTLVRMTFTMTTFTCQNDFTRLHSLIRMSFHDYLHLLEWLCMTNFTYWMNDYLHLLEWLPSLVRINFVWLTWWNEFLDDLHLNVFPWLTSLVRMSFHDYLHLLEWLYKTTFTC